MKLRMKAGAAVRGPTSFILAIGFLSLIIGQAALSSHRTVSAQDLTSTQRADLCKSKKQLLQQYEETAPRIRWQLQSWQVERDNLLKLVNASREYLDFLRNFSYEAVLSNDRALQGQLTPDQREAFKFLRGLSLQNILLIDEIISETAGRGYPSQQMVTSSGIYRQADNQLQRLGMEQQRIATQIWTLRAAVESLRCDQPAATGGETTQAVRGEQFQPLSVIGLCHVEYAGVMQNGKWVPPYKATDTTVGISAKWNDVQHVYEVTFGSGQRAIGTSPSFSFDDGCQQAAPFNCDNRCANDFVPGCLYTQRKTWLAKGEVAVGTESISLRVEWYDKDSPAYMAKGTATCNLRKR